MVRTVNADWILWAALSVSIGSTLLAVLVFVFWRKFKMKVVLEPAEFKEALAEWLKNHHNMVLNGEPVFRVHDPENDVVDEETGEVELGAVDVQVISPTKPK